MDTAEIAVIAGGAALMGLTLWWFFGPRPRTAAHTTAEGVQTVRVNVKGAYDPDTIVLQAGRPTRLEFYRDETAACSERIVFPDLGISKNLPAFETTAIEFTPRDPGEYPFACGMGMMRGRLIVEPA